MAKPSSDVQHKVTDLSKPIAAYLSRLKILERGDWVGRESEARRRGGLGERNTVFPFLPGDFRLPSVPGARLITPRPTRAI